MFHYDGSGDHIASPSVIASGMSELINVIFRKATRGQGVVITRWPASQATRALKFSANFVNSLTISSLEEHELFTQSNHSPKYAVLKTAAALFPCKHTGGA